MLQGTVEERIMEMVKHRMEGTGSAHPSTSSFPNWSGYNPYYAMAGPAREQVQLNIWCTLYSLCELTLTCPFAAGIACKFSSCHDTPLHWRCCAC